MQHHDLLLVGAEVGAAFVGFSTIVAILRPQTSHSEVRFHSLRDVAELGLYVIGGSLAPLVIAGWGASEPLAWQLSSVLLSATWIVGLVFAVRRFSRAGSPGPSELSPSWAVLTLITGVACNAMLWWNAAAPGGALAPTRYVTALFGLLLIAGALFVLATFSRR